MHDQPLNAWMHLVQSTFNQDGATRFTWRPTKDYLKTALTHLTFLTTAQHTAVNNTMFDAHAFIPNGAFAMTAAPPTGPDVSADQVYGALPDPQHADALQSAILGQIDMMMVGTAHVTYLAAAQLHEPALHDMFPYDRTTQSAQYQAVTDFYHHLMQAQSTIESNQQRRIDAYKQRHANAKTVPNSVSYPYLSVEQVMACIQRLSENALPLPL